MRFKKTIIDCSIYSVFPGQESEIDLKEIFVALTEKRFRVDAVVIFPLDQYINCTSREIKNDSN